MRIKQSKMMKFILGNQKFAGAGKSVLRFFFNF